MDWQFALVALLVLAAAGYLCRLTWRTWTGRKDGGCSGACSCPRSSEPAPSTSKTAKPPLIGEEELTARLRKPR